MSRAPPRPVGLTGGVTSDDVARPAGREGPPVPRLAGDTVRSARREFQRRVFRAALIVDGVVVATALVGLLAWRLRTLLLLIAVSLFMTVLLHPLVSLLERRGVRRGLATGVVFVAGVAVIGTVLFVILTPLVDAAEHLASQLPAIIKQAEAGRGEIGHYVKKFHLLHYVTARNTGAEALVSRFSRPALSIGRGVLSGVVGLVTVFFLTFFLLIHAPRIFRGILEWMHPDRAVRVRQVVTDVERSVVGYIAGDFATSLIAGAAVTITLFVTGVPYPLVLGIWVALVDFLPLVGGLLAGVPTVLIALLHSVPAGVATLIVFLVVQEVENHVLYPIIMSRTVRLNSLWVLVSVLLGAELGDVVGSVFGGFIGALLAVPAGSAVQVIARDLWVHRTGAAVVGAPPSAAERARAGTSPLETGALAPLGQAGTEPPPQAGGTGRARQRRRGGRPGPPPRDR